MTAEDTSLIPEIAGPVVNLDVETKPQKNIIDHVKDKVEKWGEKIYDFVRFRQLKIKEHFGRINESEFSELLDYDFKGELKDNRPGNSYGSQTRAWGACRMFLEREIEFNADVSKDKLKGWVDRFGTEYKFGQDRRDTAQRVIDGYFEKRAKAKELMGRYSDKKDLVNHLTNLSFAEGTDFDVTLGPMSININTNEVAFSDIYNRKHGSIDIPYLGFATSSGEGSEEVYYTVINNQRTGNKNLKQSVQKHELQHIQNRLFRNILNSEIDTEYSDKLRRDFEEEKDKKIKDSKLRKWLTYERMDALTRAKDELTAMVKGGTPEKRAAKRVLMKDKGPYDYLSDTRDGVMENNGNKKISRQILVSEYEKIVKQGMNAFKKLRRQVVLSREFAIAILADKPIDEWPHAVDRMIREQKGSRSVLVPA